jgi:hypothetical protein
MSMRYGTRDERGLFFLWDTEDRRLVGGVRSELPRGGRF